MTKLTPLAALLLLLPAGSAPPDNPIDAYFAALWDAEGLRAAPPADDEMLLRRVTFDLLGRAPTPDEVRRYVADSSSNKADRLVDWAFEQDDHAGYWADVWLRALIQYRINEQDPYRIHFSAFRNWLKDAVSSDMPYDRFVRELLTSEGDNYEQPATNFVLKYVPLGGTPEELANRTASIFLGMSIRCAQCHDHPYEPWTRQDYWNFAAFVHGARPRVRQTFERLRVGLLEREHRAPLQPEGLAEPATARFPDGRAPQEGETGRTALARILLEDRQYLRAYVNRIWGHFFGDPFVQPLDGFGEMAQPRDADLLDTLVDWFDAHDRSPRALMRLIVTSDAYRRSSRGGEGVAAMTIKPLNIVQITRAIVDTFNLQAFLDEAYRQFAENAGLPEYFRNEDLFRMYIFGYITELITTRTEHDEEPTYAGSVRLALRMMNNTDLQNIMRVPNGRLASILRDHEDPAERVEEIYLTVLNRLPTMRERERGEAYAIEDRDRRRAFEDLYWALVNSSEFFFVP